MLEEAADRLMAQSKDPHNNDVKDLIIKEVDLIKAELANREKNAELSSGITIMKSVRNEDGTILTAKPLVTIETPKAVIKAASTIKRAAHFVGISVADIFSNIKDVFNKKAPESKSTKSKPIKPETKAIQSVKSEMPVQEHGQEKEPLFSIAELKSDKYAPTSSKDKDIDRTKKNDLDL